MNAPIILLFSRNWVAGLTDEDITMDVNEMGHIKETLKREFSTN